MTVLLGFEFSFLFSSSAAVRKSVGKRCESGAYFLLTWLISLVLTTSK